MRRLPLITSLSGAALLAAGFAAAPAAAQDGSYRTRTVVIFGKDECPKATNPDEIIVCARRPEDLAGSAGSYQLRAEILRRVNLIAAPGKVDAVLIEEMLVQ